MVGARLAFAGAGAASSSERIGIRPHFFCPQRQHAERARQSRSNCLARNSRRLGSRAARQLLSLAGRLLIGRRSREIDGFFPAAARVCPSVSRPVSQPACLRRRHFWDSLAADPLLRRLSAADEDEDIMARLGKGRATDTAKARRAACSASPVRRRPDKQWTLSGQMLMRRCRFRFLASRLRQSRRCCCCRCCFLAARRTSMKV